MSRNPHQLTVIIPSLPLGYDLLRPKFGLGYPDPRGLAAVAEIIVGKGVVISAATWKDSILEVIGVEYRFCSCE